MIMSRLMPTGASADICRAPIPFLNQADALKVSCSSRCSFDHRFARSAREEPIHLADHPLRPPCAASFARRTH